MTIVGLFVGGRSARMGGRPKGLLRAPDTGAALVVRTAELVAAVGLRLALVGDARAYLAALPGVGQVADEPAGIGPLGGLIGLLRAAGAGRAVALACDQPYLDEPTLRALAAHPSDADVLAARRGEAAPWEPFLARYDAPRVLPAALAARDAGRHGLQTLLRALRVDALPLADPRVADDWDTPDDVAAGRDPRP